MIVYAAYREKVKEATANARRRIDAFLDSGSFMEVGSFVARRPTELDLYAEGAPAEGVVTGWGTVGGAPVCVFAQDSAAAGGAISEMQAKKIVSVYDYAVKTGVPVVGFFDSKGARLAEGVDALDGYAKLIAAVREASGVVPQIAIISGICGGAAAVAASLFDFRVVTEKGELFMHSPTVLAATFEKPERPASGEAAAASGLADLWVKDDGEAAAAARALIALLPSNSGGDKNLDISRDDINRLVSEGDMAGGDARAVLSQIADAGTVFEVGSLFAPEAMTAFARFDGETVGVAGATGVLSADACEKLAGFVSFCDAFGISLLTVVNASGFEVSYEFEKSGVFAAAALAAAYADASVATLTLITGKATGSAYSVLGAKGLGCDIALAWPAAEISALSPEAAVTLFAGDIIKKASDPVAERAKLASEYAEKLAAPYEAAKRGFIDEIIEPAETRKAVVYALGLLSAKEIC